MQSEKARASSTSGPHGVRRRPSALETARAERDETARQLIAYQERIRTLSAQISLTEEEERRRIAAGLHDHIGQNLAVAKLKLGVLQAAGGLPGELLAACEEIRALIDQSIRATRTLTFELSSPVLNTLGLRAALEDLAERTQEQHGILCCFAADRQAMPLARAKEVVLFRVTRELIFNAVKHAQARTISLVLERVRDQIQICLGDDGVGFDAGCFSDSFCRRPEAFGLFSVREQLAFIGGCFEIKSAPGCGTQLVVTAPLDEPLREPREPRS
jgi:signal transduction histidine kinase